MSDQLRPLIDARRPEELADSRRSGITAPPLGDLPGVITAADPPHGTTNFQSFWLLLAQDAAMRRDQLLAGLM